MAQLDPEQQVLLHDVCVLWLWVKKHMERKFAGEIVRQHEELFRDGLFDIYLAWGTVGRQKYLARSVTTSLVAKNIWLGVSRRRWSPKIFG